MPLKPAKGKALVVDDDKALLRVAPKLLRYYIEHVDTAATIEEALQLCKQTKYDLLIVDYDLSTGTGAELIDQVRGTANAPRYTVLFSGGIQLGDGPSMAKAVGADTWLSKPASLEEIEAVIKAALDKVSH